MQGFFIRTTKTDQTDADAHVALSICLTHISEGTFSHAAAHM